MVHIGINLSAERGKILTKDTNLKLLQNIQKTTKGKVNSRVEKIIDLTIIFEKRKNKVLLCSSSDSVHNRSYNTWRFY